MANAMKNISRGPDGWVVRLVRDGEEYSKYFRFSNGGIQKSLRRARRWRDARLKELGPRTWHVGPRKKSSNNTSGVTGVSKNVRHGVWVATWHEEGKQHFRSFQTKREAVAFRRKQLSRLAR